MSEPRKTRSVTFSMTHDMLAKLDELVIATSVPSRSTLVQMAINALYSKQFPAYQGKPSPIRVTGTNDPLVQATEQLKMRKTAQRQAKTAEQEEIFQYGEYVCKNFFPKGKVVGLEGGINTAKIIYHKIGERSLKLAMSEPLLKDLPMGTGVWEDDTVLRGFVMRYVMPDLFIDEANEAKTLKIYESMIRMMKIGIAEGEMELEAIPRPILSEFLNLSKKKGVRQELLEELESYLV